MTKPTSREEVEAGIAELAPGWGRYGNAEGPLFDVFRLMLGRIETVRDEFAVPVGLLEKTIASPEFCELLSRMRPVATGEAPETKAQLIARLAPNYEECKREEADEDEFCRRAGLYRKFGREWEFDTRLTGDADGTEYIWLRKIAPPVPVSEGGRVPAVSDGAMEWLAYRRSIAEISDCYAGLAEKKNVPFIDEIVAALKRPALPDAERLLRALRDEGFWTGGEVQGSAINAVRRALERVK